MSIFTWLFPAKKDTHAAVCMKGKGRFQTEVTDCELFQQAFERLCAGYDFDGEPLTAQATLVELPYDPRNRHPVQVEAKGQVIGDLRDRDAKRFLLNQPCKSRRSSKRSSFSWLSVDISSSILRTPCMIVV